MGLQENMKKWGKRATKVVDDESAAEWIGNLKIRYEVVEVTSWKVEWWDASERETVKKESISETTPEKSDSKRNVERKNFRNVFLSLHKFW
jgi:hypothetical protein